MFRKLFRKRAEQYYPNPRSKDGMLRVWWSNNYGTEYFYVNFPNDAIKVLKHLEEKDLKDKSITWNSGGLEVFEDGEWREWYDVYGADIDDLMDEY